MIRKIRILVIPSDHAGCGYYRSVKPHEWIKDNLSEFFDVCIRYDFNNMPCPIDMFLRQFDIIHIHKQLDKECQIIRMAKFLGVKVIVDVDDNWYLGIHHPMSMMARMEHWEIPIINSLKLADLCTTTTPIFATEIKKHNSNVAVLPNAIDPNEKQFIPIEQKDTKRLRFGMICGSSHLYDFKLLQGIISKLSKETLDKIQFVLCGFDTRGNKTIRNEITKEIKTVPLEPKESCWYEYERILTDDYNTVSPEHKDFLMKFIPQSDYPNHDEAYRRCWTKDISEYATHYNNIDVLLVPLEKNDFNKVKSQLKVIEAGFFHKGIIASDFGPYTLDLKSIVKENQIVDDGNALLCEEEKGVKLWAKWITYLADNPDVVKKMQDNLYETVHEKYRIDTVSKERARKYVELVGRTDIQID